MYDELVKRLRMQAEVERFFTGEPMLYEQSADAIEELSKPQWIPVTERLPEDGQQVLTLYTLKTIPPCSRHRILFFSINLESVCEFEFEGENHSGFYACDSEYGFYEVHDITHWMPLPEPPKEGE